MYAFGVLVLAVVAVVYPVVGADAQQQHKLFPFDLQTNATSWEFQLNTPLDPAAVNTTQRTALAYLTAFGSLKQNHFKIKKTAAFTPATCDMRYWLVGSANRSTSFVLLKMRKWRTGDRANTTDLTIKLKKSSNQTVMLEKMVPNVTQKLENDVHCAGPVGTFSTSITNRNFPQQLDDRNFTTLADIVPYFSPNLASYLNLSPTAPVVETKRGAAMVSKVKVKFNNKVNGVNATRAKVTFFSASWWSLVDVTPVEERDVELSVRIKREKAEDLSAVQSALATAQALFTSMVNSTIDNNSCVPPAL
eukprot:PhM_4_TR16441/c0_g2_i2/m.1833